MGRGSFHRRGTGPDRGGLTASVRLGSIAALTTTGYGRIVLVKATLLMVLAALGLYVRARLLPAVRNHRAAPVLALTTAELMIMAVALGLAAALTRLAP